MVAEFKQLSFLNNHNAIQDQTTSGQIALCTIQQYKINMHGYLKLYTFKNLFRITKLLHKSYTVNPR
jgi:hypothetical protein